MPITPHESPESSSPIITRAVAAGLQNKYTDNYQLPAWQKIFLNALGALPQSVGRFAISRFQSISGLPAQSLNHFSLDDLIRVRLADYTQIKEAVPAITIGAGLGGATTYLALALGSLFLPQAFVITLKGGSYDGDAREYLNRTRDAALKIAEQDKRLMTVQHFDPIHDGWLTRYVNHLRFKLVDLPKQYKIFIKQKLERGGALVYLEGGASWLRYRLGERSVFQVGGWGDISAEEFLSASERIKHYARKTGLRYADWRLTEYPLERGPESEWGSEPGLSSALETFCADEGYRFVKIHLPHPDDFSRLAFASAQKLLEKENREAAGVSVECFSQFDATAAHLSGLLPLWLIFNTQDSARYLKSMAGQFPKDKPVFFSPLATFSLTPDIATMDEWRESLGRADFINTGARESHYPADARALVNWVKPLREWVEKNKNPITARLSAEELLEISKL